MQRPAPGKRSRALAAEPSTRFAAIFAIRHARPARHFAREKGELTGPCHRKKIAWRIVMSNVILRSEIEHNVARLRSEETDLGRRSTLDARRSTLDARRSTLDARCSMLDARRSMLDARRSMLDARCSMLDARCSTLDARPMVDARWSMLDARCSMLGARCSMLDARCSVLGARCSVLGARCSVLDARCSVLGADVFGRRQRRRTTDRLRNRGERPS